VAGRSWLNRLLVAIGGVLAGVMIGRLRCGLTAAGAGVVCSSGQPAVVGTSRSTTRNATDNTVSPSLHMRCEFIVGQSGHAV